MASNISKIKTFPFFKMFNYQTGKAMSLTGAESIKACLSMLITTCRGELLGDANFGTNIKSYIMNYKGEILYDLIKNDIVEAVERYEKRVELSESGIIIYKSENNPNVIRIDINYINKTTGETDSLKLTLNEGEI